MSSSDTHPIIGIVRSVAGRPRRKRAMIAIPAFLLATAFLFGGAPMATAAPAVANNGIATFWEPDDCRGNKPGVCPNYSTGLMNQQGTLNQQSTTSPNQHITTNESPSPQRQSPTPQR